MFIKSNIEKNCEGQLSSWTNNCLYWFFLKMKGSNSCICCSISFHLYISFNLFLIFIIAVTPTVAWCGWEEARPTSFLPLPGNWPVWPCICIVSLFCISQCICIVFVLTPLALYWNQNPSPSSPLSSSLLCTRSTPGRCNAIFPCFIARRLKGKWPNGAYKAPVQNDFVGKIREQGGRRPVFVPFCH